MGINPKNHSVKKLLNIVDFLVVNGPKLASCYRQINSFSFANCCAMFAEHNEQWVRTWPHPSVSPTSMFAINMYTIYTNNTLLLGPSQHTSNLFTIGRFIGYRLLQQRTCNYKWNMNVKFYWTSTRHMEPFDKFSAAISWKCVPGCLDPTCV